MSNQNAITDDNGYKSLIGESSVTPGETVRIKANPLTGAVLAEIVVSGD